ncbi:MAG: hypothetical protein JO199_08210, partial [Candidatus Eremiobacteraeota bacterium]|nr:hypothetical protein [Candidatus Eremiobacteraeota bacterium]
MMESQRGSTLIELLVAVGAIVLLAVAGGVFLLGMRPGALAQATTDVDAALAAAHALASTSGNGATIVFSARKPPATT